MIGAVAKAIGSVGKAASSAGKFGSETMEGLKPAVENVTRVVVPSLEIRQPLSGSSKEFVSGLMVKGDSGSLGVRSALESLANFDGGESTEQKEITEQERLRREMEEQQRAKAAKRNEPKNDLANALTPPTYEPGEEPTHIISKSLEELPQALGESPANTPITNPR